MPKVINIKTGYKGSCIRRAHSFEDSSFESSRLRISLIQQHESVTSKEAAHLYCLSSEHSPPFSKSILYE